MAQPIMTKCKVPRRSWHSLTELYAKSEELTKAKIQCENFQETRNLFALKAESFDEVICAESFEEEYSLKVEVLLGGRWQLWRPPTLWQPNN